MKNAGSKCRVLIVDDSPVARECLVHILASDPDLQIVGLAADGEDALRWVLKERPDVITMDIEMPRMNGFEATRRIMEECPTPIVIITASWDPADVARTFQSLDCGALAVLEKPPAPCHPGMPAAQEIISTIKSMAEVPVVRRWIKSARAGAPAKQRPAPAYAWKEDGPPRLVAIGASTGGPSVLNQLLSGLPPEFPVPIVIVQHIAVGFTAGLASWLGQHTALQVRVPSSGENLKPGAVYLAPDHIHLAVSSQLTATHSMDPPEHGMRPSVSHLFRSVARNVGPQAVGILCTGMGEDGAAELGEIRSAGGLTVAQDEESSVVFGMPGEAVRLGAARIVMPPEGIANLLLNMARKLKGENT